MVGGSHPPAAELSIGALLGGLCRPVASTGTVDCTGIALRDIEEKERFMRNAQAGRRRGRGGQRPQQGGGDGNRMQPRQRGNAHQLLEKYTNLARDAQQQGDRVLSEYYLQHADHYHRVLAEFRARQDERQQQYQQHNERRPQGRDRDRDEEQDGNVADDVDDDANDFDDDDGGALRTISRRARDDGDHDDGDEDERGAAARGGQSEDDDGAGRGRRPRRGRRPQRGRDESAADTEAEPVEA